MKCTPPDSPATPVDRATSKLRIVLILVLLGCATALPISRHFLYAKPSPPPVTAPSSTKLKFYSQRISDDPSDVNAYVQLGKLEQQAGYFTDATRRLYAARALKASDKDVSQPLGRCLLFLGHFDEARAEMEKAAKLSPDSIRAAGELADVYDAEQNRDKAAEVMAQFLDRHPHLEQDSSPTAIASLEQLLYYFLSDNKSTLAMRIANDLVRLAPNRPEGYMISGQLLVTDKKTKLALERLKTAYSLAPNESSICYTLGLALYAEGHENQALEMWKKTVALDPKSIEAYYRLSEVYDRKRDYVHCSMALQQIALSDLTNAGAAAAAAFAFNKAGQPMPAAYWKSVESAARHDFAGQLKYARIALQDPTWHKRALGSIASAYHGLHQMKDYVATMVQVTSAKTADDDILMAAAYGAADQMDNQNRMLKSALQKLPKNPAEIYRSLSEVADKQGLRDDAETYIQKAIGMKPDNATYHITLGILYMERRSEGGRLQRAIEEFKNFIKLAPYEIDGYQQIGIAYAANNDLGRAAHYLEHALDLQPGDGVTYQELAKVYAKQGDKSGSETMFALYRKYIAYDLQHKTLTTESRARKKDPGAQLALGEFLEKSGNYADALQYYQLAKTLNPGSPEIQSKIKRVESLLGESLN